MVNHGADLKYTIRPHDISLTDPSTKHPLSGPDGQAPARKFEEHVVQCWLSDDRMGRTPKDLELVLKVLASVERLKPGHVWALEDAEYEKLKPIVEAPVLGYTNPLLNAQVLPFSKAFLAATSEPPLPMPNDTVV